jgi:Spirocyclase AveC-like
VANPNPPADLQPLRWGGLSVDDFWVPIFYAVTAGVMVWMITLLVRHRRRAGRHHAALPIFIVLFAQIFMDPLYNWAMYCNYYPNLLHWPVSWSVMNVSPTVEPLWIVMGAYQVFFLGPAWAAFVLYQKLLAGRVRRGSWSDRHPVLILFLFAWIIGAGADILMEQWMINMNIYKYTQIAGPYITWGHGHLQVYEILWIGLLIALCAILFHHDDRGRHFAQRVSEAVRAKRLRVGATGVAVALITTGLLAYGGFWAALRLTGNADRVVPGGWPYPTAKVYDPDGRQAAAGVPGPYFSGTWCTGSHCGES